jgi:glucose/mannose-6-phosphate isomerase
MIRGTPVLDRLQKVEKIDKSGMLKICMKMPEYCRDAVQRAKRTKIPEKVKVSDKNVFQYKRPKNIIVVGMGGSGIGGEILRDWQNDRIPVPLDVCRDYVLPAYADKDTLVFAVSYSGNTEETLSAFLDAVKRGCMVVTVTSGGHLLSLSEKVHIPSLTIPMVVGCPPRAAIAYTFFPLAIILEKMGILSSIDEEIEEAIEILEKLSRENAPQIPTKNNFAKKLAMELRNTIPVVYGFRQYAAIAQRLKAQFNENTKIPSKQEVFPELKHNEVMGWEAPEALTKQFSIILLRDQNEPPEIRHQIEATRLLALKEIERVLEIHADGKGKLARMLSAMYVGDLASVYLAVLRGTDPMPVETINKIKQEMARRFNALEKLEEETRRIIGA